MVRELILLSLVVPALALADSARSEEVSVGKAPFVLPGTLSVPVGEGPFPAVVLVHGSGPSDRDATVGGVKLFRDLADGLSARGVVVLRYDKRTFAYRGKLGPKITMDQEILDDAVDAVALLRARPEVDPKRIYIVGHSLGALVTPEIGVRAQPIAGVVLLAPPGRPPWEVLPQQLAYLGTPADKVAEVEKKLALIRSGKGDDENLLGAPGSYWRDWGARDGVAMVKKLGRPVLILRGSRDYQVIEADLAHWQEGLSGVRKVFVETMPGLNHLFVTGTEKSVPAEYLTPGHADPALVARIVAFLQGPR
jgi:uncharacterized protein